MDALVATKLESTSVRNWRVSAVRFARARAAFLAVIRGSEGCSARVLEPAADTTDRGIHCSRPDRVHTSRLSDA